MTILKCKTHIIYRFYKYILNLTFDYDNVIRISKWINKHIIINFLSFLKILLIY